MVIKKMKELNRILITGASGFIGSHLARRILDKFCELAIIKRHDSDFQKIKDLYRKIKKYDADLADTDKVYKIISDFKPDIIFHLAAYYSVQHKRQEISELINTNVLGTMNLLEAAMEQNVRLFVNTSSCFVYKSSRNKLKENAQLNPFNLYALTKIQAEQACSFYSEKYKLPAVTFRLFPPYGPGDNERKLIPSVIRNMIKGENIKLTTGKQKWDYVHVDDIVEAYLKLMSVYKNTGKHEIFNIGTGKAVSLRDIVSKIKEKTGAEREPQWGTVPHRQNEIWFNCADINKAKRLLEWEPKLDILSKGLDSTIEWYMRLS